MKTHRLLLAVVVAAILVLLLAVPAQAAIDDVEFIGATYSDTDPFYGVNVVGYTYTSDAVTTATVVAQIENDTGEDISVQSATLDFDWEGGPVTGSAPSTIADGEASFASFSFDVPDNDIASNHATHDYTITVEYQLEDDSARVQRTNVLVGDGLDTTFNLPLTPVGPGSLSMFLVDDDGTKEDIPSGDYTVNYWTGVVTFGAAPGEEATDDVYASWKGITDIGDGDWDETEFTLPGIPATARVASDSLNVWLQEDTDSLVAQTEGEHYTFDRETGVITFTTAPEMGQNVVAGWDYYRFWQNTGANFVVYSSDQNTALAANDQYAAAVAVYGGLLGITEAAPAKTRELLSQAAEQAALGDQDFEAGSFADAATHYQSALELLEDAIDADKDLVKQNVSVSSIAVWIAGFGILILGLGVIIYAIRWKSAPAEVD